ncbi:MAG: monofunctional biosynthetic peptidoglycan transglycosylase [Acidobacteria bacterium]|nr:monofunctional biosynthetic peptidoglycan transglycosylase [Acidobacteriota bacterium]
MRSLWNRFRRKRRRRLPRFVRWTLYLILGFYAFCSIALIGLRWFVPVATGVQIQRRVESFFEEGAYQLVQVFIPLEQIPLDLQRAVIAAEDGRFYEHSGIDWLELEKVFEEAETRGRLRGGSTISQQLVKNLFLTTHRWPVRKVLEVSLVPIEEFVLSKDRILELYLNYIEWGPGIWGVEAASRYHYGIAASQLNRGQSARLAACIPDPRRRRPSQMDTYSEIILERMRSRGW